MGRALVKLRADMILERGGSLQECGIGCASRAVSVELSVMMCGHVVILLRVSVMWVLSESAQASRVAGEEVWRRRGTARVMGRYARPES